MTMIQPFPVFQDTVEDNCLRLFLDYHGLELLWSWITDSKEGAEDVKIMVSLSI